MRGISVSLGDRGFSFLFFYKVSEGFRIRFRDSGI